MNFAVFHQDCPKLGEVGGVPQMRDVTRFPIPSNTQKQFPLPYRIYQCGHCGAQIEVSFLKRPE